MNDGNGASINDGTLNIKGDMIHYWNMGCLARVATFLSAAQERSEIDSKQGARELASYFLLILYSLATLAKLKVSSEEMEQVARVALSVV